MTMTFNEKFNEHADVNSNASETLSQTAGLLMSHRKVHSTRHWEQQIQQAGYQSAHRHPWSVVYHALNITVWNQNC